MKYGRVAPTLASLLLLCCVATAAGQDASTDAKAVLDKASKAIGAADLRTIEYSGSGLRFAFGQSINPFVTGPRFNAKTYTRDVDYTILATREDWIRTQALFPPRGGALQPIVGEQVNITLVNGDFAWNVNPDQSVVAQPATVSDRMAEVWLTPHGFLQGAAKYNATVEPRVANGKRFAVVTFTTPNGSRFSGYINAQNLVERVQTWIDNPVIGDTLLESAYSSYKDFGGIKFPTRIVQSQGGHPVFDLTITDVKANAAMDLSVPEAVRNAPPPPLEHVGAQKLADGLYYLTGGAVYSALVEFKDFVVIIEGPVNDERAMAVMATAAQLVPGKPIRYVVNTHQHYDHSGGLRAFVAEGIPVITQIENLPFYRQTFRGSAPHTIHPDRQSAAKATPHIEGVSQPRTITDGTRKLEIFPVVGNTHDEGMLMAYLPAEKMLIEADAYTPVPQNAPPDPVTPFMLNLYDNIQRFKLDVSELVPLHVRPVSMKEFAELLGKSETAPPSVPQR